MEKSTDIIVHEFLGLELELRQVTEERFRYTNIVIVARI